QCAAFARWGMGCLGDCALFISFRNVTHMFGSIETMIPEDISCPRDIKVRSDVYDVHFDVTSINLSRSCSSALNRSGVDNLAKSVASAMRASVRNFGRNTLRK